MAIIDLNKKPIIVDRNNDIFIGIDLPFRKSGGSEGWFASTSTTIKAVKNNIRLLLQTQKGERLMQPQLGLNLQKYLFEQITIDTKASIETDISDTFSFWLPFVEIVELQIDMGEDVDVGRNTIYISLTFRINKDPNTEDSIQVTLGEQ